MAPEKLKDAWQAKADELGKQFQLERRIVLAIRFEYDESARRDIDLERELTSRLRSAELRDVQVVLLESLSASVGWKRFRIEGQLVADAEAAPRAKLELKLRDMDREADKGYDWSASELLAPVPLLTHKPDAPARDGRGVAPIEPALDRLALALVRHLTWLRYDHFDVGQRLAAEGQKSRAVEEFLKFLFCTCDFDTPQAHEANQSVADELHFSVLDWLWGEPEAALVGPHRSGRRLPIGFRAAPGEPPNGDLPHTIVCLRDGTEMVLVPGGTETMGDDAGQPDERPAHRVTLAPFYIDKLETSVGQYEQFLAATGHRVPQPNDDREPTQWERRSAKTVSSSLPVVHVSWHDAMAYALWADKSLPTEAQWERAARGRFAADYPRSVDPSFTGHVNAGHRDSAANRLMSVYSFPAVPSPYGCQNMLGNVSEWCLDWYAPDCYSRSTWQDSYGPDFGERRVIRGGSWRTPLEELGPTRRAALPPTTRAATVGFRCALNLPIQN